MDKENEIVVVNAAGVFADQTVAIQEARRQAYVLTADPLFFGWQRGDNTEQEWLDAVEKIRLDNPYPVKDNPV